MHSWNNKSYMFWELFIESVKEKRMLYIKSDKLYRNREDVKYLWAAIGAQMEISGYVKIFTSWSHLAYFSTYIGIKVITHARLKKSQLF